MSEEVKCKTCKWWHTAAYQPRNWGYCHNGLVEAQTDKRQAEDRDPLECEQSYGCIWHEFKDEPTT